MTDDVSWFWAGEHGRDQILRESVDSLHAQLSASSRQSSRLSSQLAALQGSMEARLSALSVAFDAYVELGDIREQLAGYPDTSQIRREVREALTAVTDGRRATPIDARDLPYWLPHATNAVLALAAGGRDEAAEDTARSLSPEGELFMVAAAGAIGHGAAVAGRVANLLIADGTWSESQVALFRASSAGQYGDPATVLASIHPTLQPVIAAAPETEWTRWVRRRAGDAPLARVEWVRDQVSGAGARAEGRQEEGRPAVAQPEDQLRTIVSELAGRGLGDEVELLRRAKQLRERVESPTEAAPEDDEVAEPPRRPIADVVRQAFEDAPADGAARPVLLGWLSVPLGAVLEVAETEAAQPPAFTERVSSAAGAIEVGPRGADTRVVEERVTKLRGLQPAPIWLYAFAAATGLAVVLAVILLAVGNRTAAVLMFFLAGVGVLGTLYQVRESRALRRETADGVARLHAEIATAETAAQAAEQAWRDELEQTRQLAAAVRSSLQPSTALR